MKPNKIRHLVEERWPKCHVASAAQLAGAGLESRMVAAAVEHGILLRLRRGAYVRRAYWNTLKPWDRDLLLVIAHYESTGGSARYTHASAAMLHACDVWDIGPLVHVTTQYSNSRTSAGSDVRTHRFPLSEDDLTSLWTSDGREILTTTLERTVLDCARILPRDKAAVIGDHALRKGASMEAMRQLLAESTVKRGSRRASDLLDVLDGRSESAGETRTRLLLASFGLTAFTPQVEIRTAEGLFRADFADPKERIIIEFDGRSKYTDYGPAEEVLLAERGRESALQELGWAVFRIRWEQLDRPAELRRRLFAFMDMQKRPRSA